jgi:N6-adenosine-specific RNA methylase IME4
MVDSSGGKLRIPLPNKKYNIILSDPPWNFRNYSDQWHKDNPKSRWVGNQYLLSDLKDTKSLPVQSISDNDCALFLWATYPNLPEALEVMNAWGFKYKTVAFTWIKQNKKADSLFTGMGFWTRANAEVCLLGTKGSPKRISKSVRQIVISRLRGHSQKPPEVRGRIVELLGDLPRIELFARERVEGWSSWGLEVGSNE